MIDGQNEVPLWQQTYEHDIADVFSVQSNVAQNVAASLQATITPEVKLRIESIPTSNQDAYDLFLKGKDQYSQFWNTFDASHIDQAISFYRRAIEFDAEFSNAYTGLGQSYWLLAHFSPNLEFWRLSKEYIKKAIALDVNNGWAYAELGLVQYLWDWDKEAALQSFRKGITLNPGNMESHVHFFNFLVRSGNCEEAEKELQFMKTIDKSNQRISDEVFLMMCKLDPNPPKNLDKQAFEGSDLYQLMRENYKTVIARWDTTSQFVFINNLGEAYALSGNAHMANEVIRQIPELSKRQHVSKCYISAIYMALGEEEKAYQLLEEALNERDFMVHAMFQFSVSMNKKRKDPRMRAFIERTWIPQKH